MKYVIITLDNSIIQAETSTILEISNPRLNYTNLIFTKEPTAILGEVNYTKDRLTFNLLVLTPIKLKFTNTSQL